MAAVQIAWPLGINFINSGVNNQPGANVHRLDATTDEFAVVMYAEEDCTLEKILWTQGTISASTPGTLRIGLQSVAADGKPSGTWLGGGSGYVDKSTWSTGDDGLYITSTLGTNVTVARGDVFAIVLKPQAVGTWGASNWVDVGYFGNPGIGVTTPYVLLNQAGPNSARTPNTIVRSSTRAYGFPYESIGSWAIDNTPVAPQTNDDMGAVFVLPAGMCDTYQINGIILYADLTGASAFTIALYQGTNRTVLQSIAIDSDQTGFAQGNGQNFFYFDTSTLSTLTAGTEYRVMIQADSSTSAGTVRYADLNQASDMTAYIGTSSTFHWTEWTGTAYSDITTRIPPISLLISDITEPSGGGGGLLVHPGMTGGIRG